MERADQLRNSWPDQAGKEKVKIAVAEQRRQQFSAKSAKKQRNRRIPKDQQKKRGRRPGMTDEQVEEILDFYARWGIWPPNLSRKMQKYYAEHPRLNLEERRRRLGVTEQATDTA